MQPNQTEETTASEPQNTNTTTWTKVVQRRRRRPQTLIGNKQDEDLQAGEKTAWLYIGKLQQSTTTESVVKFLNKNGIERNVVCEELNSLGRFKTFKIGIPFEALIKTEKAEFWPNGVIIRRFRLFRNNHQQGGGSLE